ncbi:MAG: cofactor assembly of complex C subunit B [Prochlorotrichaceae cyanobacterium]|jgi:hypothetical protein
MGLQHDRASFFQRFPIIVGMIGGSLLLINRFYTPDLTPAQSRADVVGTLLSAVLIFMGLLWEQIQPQSPEVVELIGEEGFDLAQDLPEAVQAELAWASQVLLTRTVTRSLLLYYQGRVLLRRGILGSKRLETPGAIVQRVLDRHRPVYLVDLKLYPGRIEFDYLPENTQGIICQPLGKQGVLILGANAPRSYSQQDEAWIEGIADKIAFTLQSCL